MISFSMCIAFSEICVIKVTYELWMDVQKKVKVSASLNFV